MRNNPDYDVHKKALGHTKKVIFSNKYLLGSGELTRTFLVLDFIFKTFIGQSDQAKTKHLHKSRYNILPCGEL